MALVVFSDQLGGEYILMVFPGIVSTGIALPLYQILEITAFPKVAVVDDGPDLKFLFSINDIWGGLEKLSPYWEVSLNDIRSPVWKMSWMVQAGGNSNWAATFKIIRLMQKGPWHLGASFNN